MSFDQKAPLWTRRDFAKGSAAVVCLPTFGALGQAAAPARQRGSGLAAITLRPLPLGSIRPQGWLLRQLAIQANGLSGHLDDFWPSVGPQSGWLGGTGESWERGPYYLDGLIPLAWSLDDGRLKAKALRFIEWTLTHQQPSGMIGPATNDDWWPRMVMTKALAQYHDATGDARVVEVLTRYFHYQLGALPSHPLDDWGRYRWQDQALIVEWLYDRTAQPFLLDLLRLLKQQGYDWTAAFHPFRHTGVTSRQVIEEEARDGERTEKMQTHGVNHGQALKVAAVQFRVTADRDGELANFHHQLGELDRYHGQPNGMFSCDEQLAGLEQTQGTELCTVVETLYSLEAALAAFGDPTIADRIERIAYNALPGTFDEMMWAHQYDQQCNQVEAALLTKPWTTNGPESNLFGLEPNFGCCTANFHQGWPKFAAHSWMHTADGGLAACMYAPCNVQTTLKDVPVRVSVRTEYPFKESVQIVLTPKQAVEAPLRLRIPGWARGALVTINGQGLEHREEPGSFLTVRRVWHDGDRIDLQLPMAVRTERGYRGAVTLVRGPLVFSVAPGVNWVELAKRGPTSDWQVFPAKPWNYGLLLNGAPVQVVEREIAAVPFSAEKPPVVLRVEALRVASWVAEDGVAGPVPVDRAEETAKKEILELQPYGSARLRLTALPEVTGADDQPEKRPRGAA